MFNKQHISQAFSAALPIVLGYIAIGIPCGILCQSIGLDMLQVFLFSVLFYSGAGQFMIPNMYLAASPLASIVASCGILCQSIGLDMLQVFLFSVLFYSGAGQFMIPNMYLAASPLASIVASVSLVNTRQMLYSASFAPECKGVSKRLAFFFAATVTDESYGVSTARFKEGDWSVDRALWVNIFSQTSWTFSNMVGVLVGGAIGIPLNIAAFAMTSIFICLLVSQRMTSAWWEARSAFRSTSRRSR